MDGCGVSSGTTWAGLSMSEGDFFFFSSWLLLLVPSVLFGRASPRVEKAIFPLPRTTRTAALRGKGGQIGAGRPLGNGRHNLPSAALQLIKGSRHDSATDGQARNTTARRHGLAAVAPRAIHTTKQRCHRASSASKAQANRCPNIPLASRAQSSQSTTHAEEPFGRRHRQCVRVPHLRSFTQSWAAPSH